MLAHLKDSEIVIFFLYLTQLLYNGEAMSQSIEELLQILDEITLPLQDGRIQKVFQPVPLAITLEIRIKQETLYLHISGQPQVSRIHLLRKKYTNPSTPHQFCQLLRRHLTGARISSIKQVESDRIIRLEYKKAQVTGFLMFDLIGRGTNIYLLDYKDTVIGVLRPGRLSIKNSYQIPFGQPKLGLYHHAPSTDDDTATKEHENLSYAFNRTLETRYEQIERKLTIDRIQQEHLSTNARCIKKAKRRLAALEGDLQKMSQYKNYQHYGELLKTSMHTIPNGSTQVTLKNYFSPEPSTITIALDPSQSIKVNLERYFKKHKKYRSSQRELVPRINTVKSELSVLEEERKRIFEGIYPAGRESAPTASKATLAPLGRNQQQKSKLPYRHFVSFDGLTIGVGRNATENDILTFRKMKGRDLWVHAQGVSGSHVAVFVGERNTIPEQTLYDAANLALLYSGRKHSRQGDVAYTLRKYVKKVKSERPGTVTITQEKNLYIELDETRLKRLKSTER